MIYLDTHVVAWLYAGRDDLLPSLVRSLVDGNELLISPIVHLELEYLYEVGKTSKPAASVVDTLARELGLLTCDLPFADVAEVACDHRWTRDPFDRIIVAQAQLRGAPLLTKDSRIRDNFDEAVWDRE